MAKFSTGLRDGMLTNTGLVEALNGGYLKMFSSLSVPVTADDAETGTLLAELSAGGDGTGLSFAPPVGGILGKSSSEVWMTEEVLASGVCTYFRFVAADDDGQSSTTAPRIQGTVGLLNSDMNVTTASMTGGEPWTLNYFNVGLPTM